MREFAFRPWPGRSSPGGPDLVTTLADRWPVAGRGTRVRWRLQPAAEEGSLVWAADAAGGAPYVFKDPDNPNKHIGFEVDLAEALAKELGRPIEFQQYEFTRLIPGVERGDFDFAMNGLEITPDRKKRVRFSRPYYIYKLQLVVRADEDRFQTLEELKKVKDAKVGTLGDTAASRLLEKMGIPTQTYDGQVEPYRDLALKRVDAVLLDLPIALYYAKKDPKLKFSGPPIEPGYYAIAFNRKNEELAKQVDAALERLIQNGQLQKIYEKWGLWNDDQKELAGEQKK